MKLIKSFFNSYNKKIEQKIRKKRYLLRFRKYTLNKIFISNGEFKHTNNKIIISLYVFNRQKRNFINKMKKLRFFSFYSINKKKKIAKKILNNSKMKIFYNLSDTGKNKILLNIIKKKYYSYSNIYKYVTNFYKKYAKKRLRYIKNFFFYKQLVYINKTKYNYTFLKYLKYCLEDLYKKNVEFNLINIKRFYLNSDILSESITLKITRKRKKILKYLKNLKRKVKIRKIKINLLIKPKRYNIFSQEKYLKNKFLKKNYISKLKYKNITGFRLEARGRLTKRYTASRSVTKFSYKGNLLNINSSVKKRSTLLLRGFLRSNLQYSKFNSKSRIGSFGIKGWISGN